MRCRARVKVARVQMAGQKILQGDRSEDMSRKLQFQMGWEGEHDTDIARWIGMGRFIHL